MTGLDQGIHRTPVGSRVIFSNLTHHDARDLPHGGRPDQVPAAQLTRQTEGVLPDQEAEEDDNQDKGHACRHKASLVEGLLRIGSVPDADKEGACNRGQDTQAGDQKRQEEQLDLELQIRAGHGYGQDHATDNGTHIRFKEVGAHTRNITYVVTNIVGDHGGVTGIILRDTGLHLTYQVGGDISRLGVDPPAHPGEEGDG